MHTSLRTKTSIVGFALFGLGAACGSEANEGSTNANVSGGSTSTGGAAPDGGAASGGNVTATGGGSSGGASDTGGATATGGASTGSGGEGAGGGSGGNAATGGSSTGGDAGTGGSATGGDAGTGGDATGGTSSGGSGGTSPTTDSEGCPLTLEGFATLNALDQNGTYGGRDGQTVTVTNQADLNTYATAEEPYVIRVQGPITFEPKGTEIRVASNKTILGVGTSGEIVQGGFFLATGVHNVIFRNLTIRDSFVDGDYDGKTQDYDGIQMDTAHHVWIDHCHLKHMGDGLIDSRKDTTYLTVSWSILSDHNKAFGIGWTENVTAQMTIHHNWLRDLNQRNPSIDNVQRAHLYNNFMQRVASYGNYARGGTNAVIENSVFEDVNNPHYYDTGSLVARGNVYRDTTGQQESSGTTYSDFDPSDYYEYTLDPTNEVEALLEKCAGPRAELGQ
jgi:pectate lyase